MMSTLSFNELRLKYEKKTGKDVTFAQDLQ